MDDSGNLPGVAGKPAASALDFASARILSQVSQTFEWGDCDARFKHIVRRQSNRGLKSVLNLCFSAKAFVISLFVSWRSHRSSYFSTYFLSFDKPCQIMEFIIPMLVYSKGSDCHGNKKGQDLGLACNRG